MPRHAFPGVRAFVDAANLALKFPADRLRQARAMAPVARVSMALAQAVEASDPAAAAAALAEADRWRGVLYLALEGVEAAIADVAAAVIPTPPAAPAGASTKPGA